LQSVPVDQDQGATEQRLQPDLVVGWEQLGSLGHLLECRFDVPALGLLHPLRRHGQPEAQPEERVPGRIRRRPYQRLGQQADGPLRGRRHRGADGQRADEDVAEHAEGIEALGVILEHQLQRGRQVACRPGEIGAGVVAVAPRHQDEPELAQGGRAQLVLGGEQVDGGFQRLSRGLGIRRLRVLAS
jgi:hypothetical protein